MKNLIWGLLLAVASFGVHADNVALGAGPIREGDGISQYKTFTVDYQFAKYVQANAGEIEGATANKFVGDLSTKWFGFSLIRQEENCNFCMFDSLGYVHMSRQTHNITSPYQFYIAVGWSYKTFSISYRHLSNANTGGKNFGEDFVVFATTFGDSF